MANTQEPASTAYLIARHPLVEVNASDEFCSIAQVAATKQESYAVPWLKTGRTFAARVIRGHEMATTGANQTAAELRITRLAQADLPEVERHLLILGAADRQARFGTSLGDAAISSYARRIDPTRAVLFGAIDPNGSIVGLAEAQPRVMQSGVEMAVSVHAPYRRRGLGRHLLALALVTAFEHGAGMAEFLFAPENRPIVSLVRALGARVAATLDRAEMSAACFA